jgi:lysyl-tRNA synthetase class 2
MKRLLAAGSGDIYQIGKAFRMGEQGARHNPEYTLLEWYREGFDHHRLIREVGELVATLLGRGAWQVWPWRALLQHVLGPGIDCADRDELERQAGDILSNVPGGLDRDGLLDLLVSHCVEPAIAAWGIVFIVDYPASQAALSRLLSSSGGSAVAARFECYVDGMELANGYWESGDPDELRARFDDDNRKRRALSLPERAIDPGFLAAMEAGLPDCAGVAMGIDRLLALRVGVDRLEEVLAFDWSRC